METKKLYTGLFLFLVEAAVVGGLAASAHAAVFNVSSVSGFRQALADVTDNNEGDIINVAGGYYDISGGELLYEPCTTGFECDDHALTIQGAGEDQTILDGGDVNRILHIDTSSLFDSLNAHITIRGMAFQNGNASFNGGGGLLVLANHANIVVEDSSFSGNSANGSNGLGGGADLRTGGERITLTNNTFSENSSIWGGGAYVYLPTGSATLTNNTFNRNSADNQQGGGVYLDIRNGTATLTSNTFNGNSASLGGGGASVYSSTGTIMLTNNTFSENSATNSGGLGGGAYVATNDITATLTDNTFSGNSAFHGGGAYIVASTEAMLTNNTFSENSGYRGGGAYVFAGDETITLHNNRFIGNLADYEGGGAYLYTGDTGTATLTNNAFSGNSASDHYGGGTYILAYSGATLTNNSFSGNSADYYGGGAYVWLNHNDGIGNIHNNIIWGNTANNGGNDGDDLFVDSDGNRDNVGSVVRLYNNDLGPNADFDTPDSEDLVITDADNYAHGANIKQDPLLVDPPNGDFHLQGGSPCINAGSADVTSLPVTDFEGDPRILGPAPDIGADEFRNLAMPFIPLLLFDN